MNDKKFADIKANADLGVCLDEDMDALIVEIGRLRGKLREAKLQKQTLFNESGWPI